MSSLYPPSQTRSLPIHSRHASNVTTRISSTEPIPRRWRKESIWQQRNATPLEECQEKYCFGDQHLLSKRRRTSLLPRLYVDQQTGEMRILSTGKIVDQTLNGVIEREANRKSPEKRFRCRAQSDVTSPMPRSFWDHSLQTKQIVISPRESDSLAVSNSPFSTNSSTMRNLLQRQSRSAESSASGFDIPTRYPRGQQRPFGLASGHQALLLRHKEIVKASRQSVPQWQHQRSSFNVKSRPIPTQHPNSVQRFLSPQPYRYDRYFKLTPQHDVAVQQRCSQEVTSYRKVSKKCEEWFSTWLD